VYMKDILVGGITRVKLSVYPISKIKFRRVKKTYERPFFINVALLHFFLLK
jgi:hypothetical protein